MNREIKFRGKDIVHNKWCYGSYMPSLREGDAPYIWVQEDRFDHYEYVSNQVYAETVGQYTGLKDKRGVEIYPGDILSSNGKLIGYVVDGVRAYCYDVRYINHPTGEKRRSLWATVTVDYKGNIEVIGNIHDNPELIQAKEDQP